MFYSQLTYEQSLKMISENPDEFKSLVQERLYKLVVINFYISLKLF